MAHHHHNFFKRTFTQAKTSPFSRKGFKKLQREHFGHIAQAGKGAIPIATTAVTVLAGPIVGEGFAYGATRAQYAVQKAANRGKGLRGHENSVAARKVANRTFRYSQIGVAVGSLGAGVAGAAAGEGSWLGVASSAVSTGLKYAGPLLSRGSGPTGVDQRAPAPIDSGFPSGGEPGAFPGSSFSPGVSGSPGPSGSGLGTLLGLGLIIYAFSKSKAA